MFIRPRRAPMRAAMVRGAAHYAGKKGQQARDQDARIQELESEQDAAAPPQAPAGMSNEAIDQLKELGQLQDSGVLTDAEFAAQKQKLLGSA
jgi:hypothetical protein